MFNVKALATLAVSAAALLANVLPANADYPGAHPAYRHALADLRYARALVDHRNGTRGVDRNEDLALDDIRAAYGAIERAGFDDGKNVDAPVSVDRGIDRRGRLDRALEALGDAHRDVVEIEQNPEAERARGFAIRSIDGAIAAIRRARFDVRTGY